MQVNGAASEHELYRYVMQSFLVFEHAVASKLIGWTADHETSGAEHVSEGTRDALDPQALADAMEMVLDAVDFGQLEEIVDR